MKVETANAIKGLRTVAVPVTDQNRALAFYVDQLGFEIRVDAPLDEIGGRWIELALPGVGTTIALAPAYGQSPAGVSTGIRLTTDDAVRLHDELSGRRVDVDDVLSWPGVPPMFGFRDPDGNSLIIVEDYGEAGDTPEPAVNADDRTAGEDSLPSARPQIVPATEWAQARESLLLAEKAATRAQDVLAARRRRLPMVKFRNDYLFTTPT
jgi:catechol 2,3-dioxygenase-like lactoylglutathione lyase family enzyme